MTAWCRYRATAARSGRTSRRTCRGLPGGATCAGIEPSRPPPGTVDGVAAAHRLDDNKPYLWKTTDYGKTWKSLTAGLPQDVYLHVVREDPKRPGLLYAGTERG